jgi:O-antigen/teichoic acid export membrane protein
MKNIIKKYKEKVSEPSLKNLLTGIGSLLSATLFSSIIKVAIIIIITKFYGKEEFGIWATITSTVAIVAIGGDLGIVNALRNKLSELYAGGVDSLKEAKKYFYTAFVIFTVLAITLSIIVLVLYNILPFEALFKTENVYIKTQGKSILLWIQFMLFFGIPLSIGNSSFFSFNEAKFSALFLMIQSILTFIFILVSSILHLSIVFLSIGYFLIILLVNLTSLLYFIKRRNWFSMGDFKFDLVLFANRCKYLFTNGFKFLGLQFSKGFIENGGTIIASSAIGLGSAAEFSLVQKLYTFSIGIYQSIFNPLWSAFTENAAKNNWMWCKTTYLITIKISSIVIPLITIMFYFYGNLFLSIISSTDYNVDESLFLIIGLASLFYMLFTSVTTFQSAINKINFITLLMILFSIILVPMAKPFIRLYGINGVALSILLVWLISFFLGNIQSLAILKRKINFRISS